jgi:lysophospholipid acyltransferase (LPLAT)-like uncharacterized protein
VKAISKIKLKIKLFKQKLVKSNFFTNLFAYSLVLYLKVAFLFQKKIFRNKGLKLAFEFSNKPCIFVFWHGRMAFIGLIALKKSYYSIIISKHNDGKLISKVMEILGFNTIRGSSNDKKNRGGVKATVEAINAIKQGQKLVITPDGPKGPAFKLKKSVLYLAQKTGVPIIPVSFSCSRKKVLSSWDSLIFPLPFGKSSFVFGQKYIIAQNLDLESFEAEGLLEQIEVELNRITVLADSLV